MTFVSRRLRNVSIVIVTTAALLLAHQAYGMALYHEQFLSGWLLLGSVLLLAGYNARTKIIMLPIGTAATWLQFHIYLGLTTIILFPLHVIPRIPNGWLEGLLATFFIAVAASGVIGLYLIPTALNIDLCDPTL